MTKAIHQFPHLISLLRHMSSDNLGAWDIPGGVYSHIVWAIPSIVATHLNSQAAKLSDREKYIMASGDDTEQKTVVAKHGIQDLDEFLNDVFDGDQGWIERWTT